METTQHAPLNAASRTFAGSPILYVLHSGEMFGTERMAIATLEGLGKSFSGLLLAPKGPAAAHARAAGIPARTFSGIWQLSREMLAFFRSTRKAVLVATGVSHSLVGLVLAALTGVRLRHVHVVHGGTDERLSYGRKKWLRWFDVDFVAVSGFVRSRLVAHGVPAGRITVIENFLTRANGPRRAAFESKVQRAVVVSRLDPIKRVDLLLDALERAPGLSAMNVDILGTGWNEKMLRARVAVHGHNVSFLGFSDKVQSHLAGADLLIHTCPEEPFGLAILEAMAAGIPVLVPDRGGPSGFIQNNSNGFVYRANDAQHLAARLIEIRQLTPQRLNQVVAAATATLRDRFSPERRINDYRVFLEGSA
jgi:glycosyltransferase involved in cell wall biosynthesis